MQIFFNLDKEYALDSFGVAGSASVKLTAILSGVWQ